MGINVINEGISKGITIPSVYVSLISLTTIIIKLFLSKYIIKKGKELDSNILISSGKESFTDVISSLIVFISVLLSKLSNINELFKYSDKIAMIIVGILIIKIAFEILRDNLSNLLGKRINDHDYEKQIDNIILNHKGIEKVDSLIIVKFGSFKKIDCEVSMDENMKLKKVHQTIDHIEKELKIKDDTISNIIIHVNPYKSV